MIRASFFASVPSRNRLSIHILEHVRRFAERLVHPGVAFASGIEEFFPNRRIPADVLIAEIKKTFRDFQETISRTPPEQADWHSLLHLMEHTGYHLGQIVDRTRRQTGREFRFCQRGLDEKTLRRLVEEELADNGPIRLTSLETTVATSGPP